ncbi:MAG: histidine triad nucleotide-binding protein [Legionella sp.]
MDCLFCMISEKKIPATVIFENDELIAFNDIKPQAPTHILVIPKKHIASISDAEPEDALLIGNMILCAQQVAKNKGFNDSGYRLVFNVNSDGGQEVPHIHLHLLGERQMTWPPG